MMMQKNKAVVLLYTVLIYSGAFLIDIIAKNVEALHFGKDDGLIFRIIATCIVSAFFWGVVIRRRTVKYFLQGFFIGLVSYLLVFLIYHFASTIIFKDNRGFDTPLLIDQLIASTLILVIALIVYFRAIKRSSQKKIL